MRSPDQTLTHIGKAIRTRRLQLGYSQERLGERAGFTQYTVCMVENGGNCKLGTLLTILQTLELELTIT